MVSILVPNSGMGPYVVARQDGSVVLTRIGKPGDRAGSSGDGNWFFPVEELPQVLAALRQAAAVAGNARPSEEYWTIGSDGHMPMQVDGPGIVHAAGPILGVMIENVDLPALLEALSAWKAP